MKYFLYVVLFSVLPLVSSAATLRLDPAEKHVGPGDVFVADVRIDVLADECVNAATVVATYDPEVLRLNALSRGESIFSLWIEEVIHHDTGVARFTAGIPAGYCGRAQGDPGQTNIIGKLVFQYVGNETSGGTIITFSPETEVILNDGLGTKTQLDIQQLSVLFVPKADVSNEWLAEVRQDTFSPESFTPEIIQDTSSPDQPYYLIFHTTDKQSGVEHYEVVEEDPRSFGFRIGSRVKAKLSRATSPYLLSDQTLSSRIVVRAYDHAGNMEETILPPRNMPLLFDPAQPDDYILPLIVMLCCGGVVSYFFYRKKKMQLQDEPHNPSEDMHVQ